MSGVIRPKFTKAIEEIKQQINNSPIGNQNSDIDTEPELRELGKYLNGEKSIGFVMNDAEKTALRRIYERAKDYVEKIAKQKNSNPVNPSDGTKATDDKKENQQDKVDQSSRYNPSNGTKNSSDNSKGKLPDGSVIHKEKDPNGKMQVVREFPNGDKKYYDLSGRELK